MSRLTWWWRLLVLLLVAGVSSGVAGQTASVTGPLAISAGWDAEPRLPSPSLEREPVLTTGRTAISAMSAVTWTQQTVLTSTAQTPNDAFGSAVALSGNTAVIGASSTPSFKSYGAAYIFVRRSITWTQQAELGDPGGLTYDQFGSAVALSGDTAVIGAVGATGAATATGVAYVYERSGSTWTLQATLAPPDGAPSDGFGSAVAISDTTIVVGAFNRFGGRGAAYIFARRGSKWSQQAEIPYPGGVPNAAFGYAVAVGGDTAVISAAYTRVAYVYVRSGIIWSLQAQLSAPPAVQGQYFGVSVALWGDTALVSACLGLPSVPAAVEVYGRHGTMWTLQATLSPPSGVVEDAFGSSVALSGHTAVIGGGPTFVYVGAGSAWSEQAELIPTGYPAYDIGYAVAVAGNTAVAGATNVNGAAYVFVRSRIGPLAPTVDGLALRLAASYKRR